MGTSKKLTHLSLCTGYGGIDIGLKRALGDISAVAYVEIEAFAVENLVAKIENNLLDVAPIWTDLKTFSWSRFRNCVDIVSGGFPCQPFSYAGKKNADTDARHLWPYIVKGVAELGRPPVVFLENVEGIISSRLKGDNWSDPESTPVLLHVLRELERMDYYATAGIFSAAEVGAPHRRKRVFIMGVRSNLGKSGRDLISQMLQESRKYTSMEYSESRNIKRTRRGGGSFKTVLLEQIRESSASYPAPRGAPQYDWEPPRVTAEDKPEMGREPDGVADRVDYAELCRSVDNRRIELQLLGNGVVPATAERAFRVLWQSLDDTRF